MKICIVVGTRPEIIKASPLIRECQKQRLDFFILHTGQHYSDNMDKIFFEELKLPAPKYNLQIGSRSHGEQTGIMLEKIEKILIEEKPSILLAIGDTNSVLAGTLAATKMHIKVGHVESGLRSYDRNMPEEQNRTVVDHLSDLLFAPTQNAAKILKGEGIPDEKIFVVGNTIVDAVLQNKKIADGSVDVFSKLGVGKRKYVLATSHRSENVDDSICLSKIIVGLEKVQKYAKLPIIFPIHPRTKKQLGEFNITIGGDIRIIEPVGYLEFLQLLSHAELVITDSGGIQEETSILKTPCVTIRDNTERPETLEIKSNKLAGVEPEKILACAIEMLNSDRNWETPYGDGRSAEKIVEILKEKLD